MKIQVTIKLPPSFRQGGRTRWVAKRGNKFVMDGVHTTVLTADDLSAEDYQILLADEKAGFLKIEQVIND